MFLRFLSLRILSRDQHCLVAMERAKIEFQTKESCSITCVLFSVDACLITSSNNLVFVYF